MIDKEKFIPGKLYRIYPIANERVIPAYSVDSFGKPCTITFCSSNKEERYIVCMLLEQYQENNGYLLESYPDIWNKFLWKDKVIVIPERHAKYEIILD